MRVCVCVAGSPTESAAIEEVLWWAKFMSLPPAYMHFGVVIVVAVVA